MNSSPAAPRALDPEFALSILEIVISSPATGGVGRRNHKASFRGSVASDAALPADRRAEVLELRRPLRCEAELKRPADVPCPTVVASAAAASSSRAACAAANSAPVRPGPSRGAWSARD